MNIRIVKFCFPNGSIDYFMTNLPHELTKRMIINLYHKRWEVETALKFQVSGWGIISSFQKPTDHYAGGSREHSPLQFLCGH